jgi:hypothetical protein
MFAVFCTALGRGIVFAFKLDVQVAGMIEHMGQPPPELLTAITWGISGLIGLVALICWLAFRVDERLYDLLVSIPALGSLSFTDDLKVILYRSASSGTATVELVAKVQNTNDFLVRFRSKLRGEANGKQFVDSDGNNSLSFDGYVNAKQSTLLVLRIADVPAPPAKGNAPSVAGTFEYDLTYFAAPNSKRTRRTSKRIAYESRAPLGLPVGTRTEEHFHVIFLEEKEE